MRHRLMIGVLMVCSTGMMSVAVWHVLKADQKLPQIEPPALPARSPFASSIAAAGIVEPRSESVAIGTALPGIVLEVFVPADKAGTRVRKGDPLFRVDDRHLRAELAAFEARLAAAQAELARLTAMPRAEALPPSEEKVRSTRAMANRAKDEYDRAEQLHRRGVATEQELITKRLSYESAQHLAAESVAQHALLVAGAWEPEKVIARGAIELVRRESLRIQTEIDRTTVRAPLDGEVLKVNVRPGEYVGPTPREPLMVLGDTSKFHVRCDIDEYDIDRFNAKSKAVAHPRGAAQNRYPLQAVRVEPVVIAKRSLTGDNVERIDTRVLQVIYAVDGANAKLFVGQQVDVFVETTPSAQ